MSLDFWLHGKFKCTFKHDNMQAEKMNMQSERENPHLNFMHCYYTLSS
jgi:hypothetical protein